MENKLTTSPLQLLYKWGLLVPNSLANIAYKLTILLAFGFATIATFMQFYYIDDVLEMFDHIEVFSADIGVSYLYLFCVFNKNKLLNLVKLSNQFWSSDKCTRSTQKKVEEMLSKCAILQKCALYTVLLNIPNVLIVSFAIEGRKLPAGTWKMVDHPTFYKMALVAILITLCGTTLCYGVQGLYFGFCCEVIAQFQILCDHLENMDLEIIETELELKKFEEKLNVYIRYHEFLIRFIKDLTECYSAAFMIQVLNTVPLVCFDCYVIFGSPKISVALKSMVTSLTLIILLASYCIPSEFMVAEALTVSNAIYNSNWYSKYNKSLRQSTLLVMQRSQQEIRVSACGLIDINPDTLISVVKLAFSASTFLRGLNNNAD